MTFCTDHTTSRYKSKFEDPLGRWSAISLMGRNGRCIHFLTVYQVVAKATTGPYTAYQQQSTALRLANRDVPPRQAFIADLDKYLEVLTREPESQLVLMGDLNEVVGHNPAGFAKIIMKFNLIDIHGHFHSLLTEVPTYARGKDRLDFVFCTPALLSVVESCGAEPFNQHIFSDHRAWFVDRKTCR